MAKASPKPPAPTPPGAAAPAHPESGALPAVLSRGPLARLGVEQRLLVLLGLLAAVVCVPWLGATGFWDPWEPHYGEVAREMIARGDYLHPWWESAWFFSKPALDLWLMAAGMLAAGTEGPERWVGVYTEWGVRLPFMLISVMGALLLFVAASRLLGRRPAFLGTVALLTAPLFVLLSRQAVPDPVFVGLLGSSMACLLIVLFEHEDATDASYSGRDGWLIAFYVFVGLATLSKGLLGFAVPGAVTLVYCILTGEWHRLRRLRLGTGALIVLAVCGPWYGHMFAFDGRDDESKTFFERFIIHDHFKRLAVGVHTTTPGGTFTYFIEQLGFDAFPWVFAIPGALATLGRARVRPRDARERAILLLLVWLLVGFSVFAFSVTKFHHYAYPVLPPLLLFCGLWLDDVLRDGLRAHAGEALAGGLLYALVAHDLVMQPKHLTDLFVYNYDRPYPDREVDPRQQFQLLFFAAPAVALSPWLFDRALQLWNFLVAFARKRTRAQARSAVATRLSGAPLVRDEAPQDRVVVVASLVGLAFAFALAIGWGHWRKLSPHWTQRDFFWLYTHQSGPDEPIAAYQMNWRGETFYSRNTVRQVSRQVAPMTSLSEFMAGPGPRKWFLTEQSRLNGLRTQLASTARVRVVENRHNKFALVVAEPLEKGAAPMGGAPESPPQPPGAGAPP